MRNDNDPIDYSMGNNIKDDSNTNKEKEDSQDNVDLLVMGIDPGRNKCGIAIVDHSYQVLYKNIIRTTDFKLYLEKLNNNYRIRVIILGNGTYSNEIKKLIKGSLEIPVRIVDEAYSTVEAEDRYRSEHKKGWQIWFPFIRWKPSVPVDDYVAVILAERFIKRNN
ncbi:MAG: pre-16S rRNA-processing nuclease YqgF [Halanaerobiales bacterium]